MTRGAILEWRLFSTVRFVNMFHESHTELGEWWLLHLNLCWYPRSSDKWRSLSLGFLLKKWFWRCKFKHQSMNTKILNTVLNAESQGARAILSTITFMPKGKWPNLKAWGSRSTWREPKRTLGKREIPTQNVQFIMISLNFACLQPKTKISRHYEGNNLTFLILSV